MRKPKSDHYAKRKRIRETGYAKVLEPNLKAQKRFDPDIWGAPSLWPDEDDLNG